MFAAYGIDVLDPRMTPRRLNVLIDRLPPWARYGGEEWGPEAHLLALLIDHVAMLAWVTSKANGAKGGSKPKPIPRPPGVPPLLGKAPASPTGPPRARPAAGEGGWMEAARKLALMPGVKVEHDG